MSSSAGNATDGEDPDSRLQCTTRQDLLSGIYMTRARDIHKRSACLWPFNEKSDLVSAQGEGNKVVAAIEDKWLCVARRGFHCYDLMNSAKMGIERRGSSKCRV